MNSKEYYEFISKFEERHTTDDCYTPPAVYDVVSDWAAKECSELNSRAAKKAAEEKAAAEKAATTVWKLSDREREIIAGLGG